MRHFLRNLVNAFVAALPPPVVRVFLKSFVGRLDMAERAGFHVYPKIFYSPFPDSAEINVAALREKRALPAIETDPVRAVGLLQELLKLAPELDRFPRRTDGAIAWAQTYPSFDAATLYTMLRKLKPKRYIEVGCGWSSRMSAVALDRNREEGFPCEACFIEPYPPEHLKEVKLPGELIKKKVQDVPLEVFKQLQSGDVLFLDTSHVMKVQNDVAYEFLFVLPSLAPGVVVHIHDVFTPYDYPEEWLVGTHPNRGAPNEQYSLECLLSGGRNWDVILPVYQLWREQRELLGRLLPGADDRSCAFWIRRRERTS